MFPHCSAEIWLGLKLSKGEARDYFRQLLPGRVSFLKLLDCTFGRTHSPRARFNIEISCYYVGLETSWFKDVDGVTARGFRLSNSTTVS